MISIDSAAPTPPYEQVRAQIAAQVADGRLVAGARLPTVRRLAEELGLAVNTVARAYRELETAGVVATRGRAGTVVTAGGNQARSRLMAEARRYADLAREVGVAPDEARRIVEEAIAGDAAQL